jgi:hypothetical protein
MPNLAPKSPVSLSDPGAVLGFVLAVAIAVALVTRLPKVGGAIVK